MHSQEAGRGDMFTAVLDKAFQSGISSPSLDCQQIDTEEDRKKETNSKRQKALLQFLQAALITELTEQNCYRAHTTGEHAKCGGK